jgi:aryl-alcohol dehydrogenase-like predicted oxidoreductase
MMFGEWGNPDHDDCVRIILPTCARYGMAIIPWSPLNGGCSHPAMEPAARRRPVKEHA